MGQEVPLRLALVVSKLTNQFWLQKTTTLGFRRKHAEWIGWKHVLEEYGYPFDVFTDMDLENLPKLSRYSLIILPEVSMMNDLAAENIIEFVRRGGALIISSKWGPFWYPDGTERRNNQGQPTFPTDFTLMMGIDSPPMKDITSGGFFSHIELSHEIYRNLSDDEARIQLSTRSIGGGFNVLTDSIAVSKIRTGMGEVPGIITHKHGNGSCIYFNFQIGGIVADYENDVCGENEGTMQELPRREGWVAGECCILKKIMKNSIDYALKTNIGLVVRVWQGVNAAKTTMILTHDVDSKYGWNSGINTLEAEEEKRGLVSTWYVQPDSPEYTPNKNKLSTLIGKGHEIGLHGTDSYANTSEMQREVGILETFFPPGYKIKSERQHYLRRNRLNTLNEEALPLSVHEAELGFICSSTFPVYSRTEPQKANSGVKCYLPYYGVCWSTANQSLVEIPILILPITLQDVWVEESFLEELGARALKSHFLAKLWTLIFSHRYERKFLLKWIETFNYCYAKEVSFCLLTHPDNKYEDGTGSPSRAKNVYGSFLDYMLNKEGVAFFTVGNFAEWWIARETVTKNLDVKVDQTINRITAVIPKTEKQGITLLLELPNKKQVSSLLVNGKEWKAFAVEGNRAFVILPKSEEKLVVEAKLTMF